MSRIEELEKVIDSLQTMDEIEAAYAALKSRRNTLDRRALRTFASGDRVAFTRRNGTRIEGQVVKVNRKTVSVEPVTGGRGWRVPAAMLTHVES